MGRLTTFTRAKSLLISLISLVFSPINASRLSFSAETVVSCASFCFVALLSHPAATSASMTIVTPRDVAKRLLHMMNLAPL